MAKRTTCDLKIHPNPRMYTTGKTAQDAGPFRVYAPETYAPSAV